MMMRGVASGPLPDTDGEISHRMLSPICGSPTIFSPGSNSKMQTCSGAHTTMGRPPPKAYTTRPSLPGPGALRLSTHSRLNITASTPVAFSATSCLASKARGTSGDTGGGAVLWDSAGTVGACFAAPFLGASPDSRARTASVNGYFAGDGTDSFFTTAGGGCAGVALGVGELFGACCARPIALPPKERASMAATAQFVFIVSSQNFRPSNIHDVDPERIHSQNGLIRRWVDRHRENASPLVRGDRFAVESALRFRPIDFITVR